MADSGVTMSADPISISSSIGTWVAAFVTIVALIGIVGPWLAIRAATSDKNRALNAVFDKDNVYVRFNGIPLGSRLRIFRRIRVPDLAPNYKSNDSGVVPLLPADDLSEMSRHCFITSSNETLTFVPPSYSHLNKGWARFCMVLESYSAGTAKFQIQKSGGTLEIVGRRTALIVSRHWILILGLLGRYSDHRGRRTYDPTGIQRALHGERHSVRGPDLDSELDGGYDIEAESDLDAIAAQQDTTLTKEGFTNVSGITGEFELLGQRSGPRLDLSTVKFSPHNGREIVGLARETEGPTAGLTTSSIAKQFWLASGIIPTNLRDKVISVEDPIHDATDVNRDLFIYSAALVSSIRYFRLRGIETIPANLKNSMISLGIGTTHVERFQEDETLRDPPRTRIRRWRPRRRYDNGIRIEREERTPQGSTQWVHLTAGDLQELPNDRRSEFEHMRFYREDIEKVAFSFLSLGWDSCGHLVWGNDCVFWRCLLKRAVIFIENNSHRGEVIQNHLVVHILDGETHPVFNWKMSGVSSEPSATFNAMKTRHLVDFGDRLLEHLSSQLIEDLRAVLGTLLIVDVSFREYIRELLHDNLLPNEYAESTNASRSSDSSDEADEEVEADANGISSSHSDYHSFHSAPGSGGARDREDNRSDGGGSSWRQSTSTSRSRLLSTPQDFLEDDEEDAQPKFLSHPHFQYDMTRRTLANRPDTPPDATVELVEWYCSVRAPFTNNPATRVVSIPTRDMIRVAMWTAARAELWLSSLNSRPLLSFCNQLSRDIYLL